MNSLHLHRHHHPRPQLGVEDHLRLHRRPRRRRLLGPRVHPVHRAPRQHAGGRRRLGRRAGLDGRACGPASCRTPLSLLEVLRGRTARWVGYTARRTWKGICLRRVFADGRESCCRWGTDKGTGRAGRAYWMGGYWSDMVFMCDGGMIRLDGHLERHHPCMIEFK